MARSAGGGNVLQPSRNPLPPEGVRIVPRPDVVVADDGIVVVIDHARPFAPPADGQRLEDVQPICSICGVQHFAKAYHIQLHDGAAIVSEEVWANLERLRTPGGDPDNPFVATNPVAGPPAQAIAPGTNGGVTLLERFVMPINTERI